MARSVQEGFDEFLTRLIPSEAQRTAAAGHRASVRAALETTLKVNNFFETGSFSHGTGIRAYSDVDALVSIGDGKPASSDTALTWVKSALQARFPSTTVQVRRPAVVVEFADGKETWEVIPGFLTGRGGDGVFVYDIPGASSGWIDSAPKTHLAYVNGVNGTAGIYGGAKKLARLLKAWKYYRNVPVSSFYLEMRAAQYMATQTNWVPIYDVCFVLEDLERHGLAAMNDPSGATGRFHPCSSEARKTDALSKLSTAATRARNALEQHRAGNPTLAFYYLDQLFNGEFPAR